MPHNALSADSSSSPSHSFATGSWGRRLSAVLLSVLTLGLVGSAIGGWSLQRIHRSTESMVAHSVANERLVADAYRLQSMNAERYKAVALSSEPEVGEILGTDIAQTQQAFEQLIAQLGQQLHTEGDGQRLTQVRSQAGRFLQARTELVAARDSGLTARIQQVYAERFLPASQALLQALDALSQSQRQAIDDAAGRVAQLSSWARLSLWAFAGLSLLLGTLLWNKNRCHGHFLSVNLPSVHILHGQLGVIRIRVVHIAEATTNSVEPVYGKVDVLHLPEAAEDLHDMFSSHVSGQSAYVNPERTRGDGALPTLLAGVVPRRGLPGTSSVLLILVHRCGTSLVIFLNAAAPWLTVTGTTTDIVDLSATRGLLVPPGRH